jgi:hypothetical protein
VIDFYDDACRTVRESGINVTPRYRKSFDHHVWPPDWNLIAKPLPSSEGRAR